METWLIAIFGITFSWIVLKIAWDFIGWIDEQIPRIDRK